MNTRSISVILTLPTCTPVIYTYTAHQYTSDGLQVNRVHQVPQKFQHFSNVYTKIMLVIRTTMY